MLRRRSGTVERLTRCEGSPDTDGKIADHELKEMRPSTAQISGWRPAAVAESVGVPFVGQQQRSIWMGSTVASRFQTGQYQEEPGEKESCRDSSMPP